MEETKKREEKRKDLLRGRRKVESELIAQGKKPFYLKKGIHSLYSPWLC